MSACRALRVGTGKDVSDETMADAKEPLQIKWLSDSFIAVPVRGVAASPCVRRSESIQGDTNPVETYSR